MTKATKPRCRAYRFESGRALSVWRRQCPNAARTETPMRVEGADEKVALPACGHHARYSERYTIDAYRPTLKGEMDVMETVTR